MEQSEVPWTTTTTTVFSSTDPLISCIFTLYSLILLYFPQFFLRILLSPVLLITGTLLISLLRLGSTREPEVRLEKISGDHNNREIPALNEAKEFGSSVPKTVQSDSRPERKTGFDWNPDFVDNFVEWNVRAPLEVIHEAYDEELEEQEEQDPTRLVRNEGEEEEQKDQTRFVGIERLPSMSLCYPESESDSDLDSWSGTDFSVTGGYRVSPETTCHRWEEEDGEGLIEIRLDDQFHCQFYRNKNKKKIELDFHAEEENLIEIDLSI